MIPAHPKYKAMYTVLRLGRFTIQVGWCLIFGFTHWHCYDKDTGWSFFAGPIVFDWEIK